MSSLISEHQITQSASSVAHTDIELSIGVAVYNVKTYLRECLDSLCKQTFKNAEFIVVDDGSTDGSSAICDEYTKKDSRFKIIHHGVNKGSLLARKTAITSAKGKYMSFMDGDDYYTTPESLTSMYELISKNDVDILKFNAECFGDKNNKVVYDLRNYIKHRLPQNKKFDTCYIFNQICSGYGVAVCVWLNIYKTNILKRASKDYPNEHLISEEDTFLFFLAIYYAKSYMEVESDFIYSYRIGSGIATSGISLQKIAQHVKGLRVVLWLNQILTREGCSGEYFDSTNALLKVLIAKIVRHIKELPSSQQEEGFNLVASECVTLQMVTCLSKIYNDIEENGRFTTRYYKLTKVIKYAVKGKWSLSHKKRVHYRNKLYELFIKA